MKIKSEVTILLTIFNRVDFTNKWLDFAELQKIPFTSIFVMEVVYKKIFEKYYLALKDIKTKFVFLVEDDDYLFIKSIEKSALFLIKNKQYSCAKGINCLGEIIKSKKKSISLVLRNEKKNEIDKSLISKSADDRLINYFKNKNVTIWNGLHTHKSLLKTFEILGKKDFYNLYITELIFCLTIISCGKIKRLNHIDYIKMDNTDFSSSYNFTKLRPFSKIVKSKFFKEENELIFKHLKFQNKNKEKNFKSIYNNIVESDKLSRINIEIKENSLQKILIKKLKQILNLINVFFILKFLKSFFQCLYYYRKIMIIDKSLIKVFKKNKKEFLRILAFNKNY